MQVQAHGFQLLYELHEDRNSTHLAQLRHIVICHIRRQNVSLMGQGNVVSGYRGGCRGRVYGGNGGLERHGRGGRGGKNNFDNGIDISDPYRFYMDDKIR